MTEALRAPPFPNPPARPAARGAARKPKPDRGPEAAHAASNKLVIALPKGRILGEVMPLLARAGIQPEPEFADEDSRKLQFRTNHPDVEIVRVRSFDVATFVAFGGAQLGIAGNDVLMEFNYSEIYAPLDLKIGRCRLVVAEPAELIVKDEPRQWSHVRVATKYPEITRAHFAARGVQAECIKLNGALELAPGLGLCRRIVDLVSTGATLKANGLVEVERIAEVSARLAVNRTALKTRPDTVMAWIDRFAQACNATPA
jgi:ATP phosphoribosyltransferase